ncbi:DUF6904 family protein [Klebsiella pneumoniae]|uniref:DUF6904 family protein n=1 Tax=Klebsiella pneumoniae TaxID=573 RepID=UPI003CCE0CFD
MLRYELTPNNAGFILWGRFRSLNELHELIHYIVDESPLIKVKDGFMLSLAYDIRKARKVIVVLSNISMINMIHIKLYGVELLWPLVRYSPQYSETQWVIFRQTKTSCLSCLLNT